MKNGKPKKAKTKKKTAIVKTPANAGQMQDGRDEKGRYVIGFSGNPAGKQLGTKNASTKFQDLLSQLNTKEKKSYLELLDKKILELIAIQGNVRMIEIILSYLYGKPTANFKDQSPSKWSGKSKEEIIEFILGGIDR